jgi:hypothetical protein
MSNHAPSPAGTLSHPVRCAEAVYLYFHNAPAGRSTQVHRAGCSHAGKADSLGGPFTGGLGADDWVYVAPCARKA